MASVTSRPRDARYLRVLRRSCHHLQHQPQRHSAFQAPGLGVTEAAQGTCSLGTAVAAAATEDDRNVGRQRQPNRQGGDHPVTANTPTPDLMAAVHTGSPDAEKRGLMEAPHGRASLGLGMRHPSSKCKTYVEGADARETSPPHELFVLLRREDGQLLADGRYRCSCLLRIDSGRDGKGGASRQCQLTLSTILRNAVVHRDECAAWFQSRMYFTQGPVPFSFAGEVKRQETGRRIERPFGRGFNIAMMQLNARGQRSESRLRQAQHFSGRINAIKLPAWERPREGLEFHAATGANDQNTPISWRALSHQKG